MIDAVLSGSERWCVEVGDCRAVLAAMRGGPWRSATAARCLTAARMGAIIPAGGECQ